MPLLHKVPSVPCRNPPWRLAPHHVSQRALWRHRSLQSRSSRSMLHLYSVRHHHLPHRQLERLLPLRLIHVPHRELVHLFLLRLKHVPHRELVHLLPPLQEHLPCRQLEHLLPTGLEHLPYRQLMHLLLRLEHLPHQELVHLLSSRLEHLPCRQLVHLLLRLEHLPHQELVHLLSPRLEHLPCRQPEHLLPTGLEHLPCRQLERLLLLWLRHLPCRQLERLLPLRLRHLPYRWLEPPCRRWLGHPFGRFPLLRPRRRPSRYKKSPSLILCHPLPSHHLLQLCVLLLQVQPRQFRLQPLQPTRRPSWILSLPGSPCPCYRLSSRLRLISRRAHRRNPLDLPKKWRRLRLQRSHFLLGPHRRR